MELGWYADSSWVRYSHCVTGAGFCLFRALPRGKDVGMRRVILLLASAAVAMLLTSFYGCGQASSPTERRESKEGVEKIARDEPKQPEQKTCEDFYGP